MFKLSDYNKGISRPEVYLYLISLFFLILLAFGKFDRYPIMGQLGLAVNLEDYKILYPNLIFEEAYLSSEYFPGVSYIIYFFRLFLPDFLIIEVMLILSILIAVFYFYLIKKIIKEIFSKDITFENYWLLALVISMWLCRDWVFYVITLKSDILAFSLIFYAFLLGKPHLVGENRNYFKLFFGLIIIAYAITIKQQAVSLLLAILIYSLLNKNLFFKFYSLLILSIVFGIFYLFYQNENLWFHTILRYIEDGFLSLNQILRIFYKDFILLFLFGIFLAFSSYHKLCNINFNEKLIFLAKNIKSNLWFYLIISFALTGIISGIKVGGNTGNTQLSLILLFPFIYIFLYDFKKTLLMFFVSGLLILEIPNIIHNTNKYIQAKKFQNTAISLIKEDNIKILSDKETFFASFLVKKNNTLISYDTLRMLNDFIYNNVSQDSYNRKILNYGYDYIFLAKYRFTEDLLTEYGYKKVYENKLGLIFRKT